MDSPAKCYQICIGLSMKLEAYSVAGKSGSVGGW